MKGSGSGLGFSMYFNPVTFPKRLFVPINGPQEVVFCAETAEQRSAWMNPSSKSVAFDPRTAATTELQHCAVDDNERLSRKRVT